MDIELPTVNLLNLLNLSPKEYETIDWKNIILPKDTIIELTKKDFDTVQFYIKHIALPIDEVFITYIKYMIGDRYFDRMTKLCKIYNNHIFHIRYKDMQINSLPWVERFMQVYILTPKSFTKKVCYDLYYNCFLQKIDYVNKFHFWFINTFIITKKITIKPKLIYNGFRKILEKSYYFEYISSNNSYRLYEMLIFISKRYRDSNINMKISNMINRYVYKRFLYRGTSRIGEKLWLVIGYPPPIYMCLYEMKKFII